MKASLQALLSSAVDYAGLFPPAKLPLDQAIHNYLRYRTENEAWMLGRFICPASRLAELPDLLAGLPSPAANPPLSALGRGGTTPEEFLEGVKADVRDILGSHVQGVVAYETRLPEGLVDVPELVGLFAGTVELFIQNRSAVASSHFEIPLAGDWRRTWEAAATAIAQVSWQRVDSAVPHLLGLKLRCGGQDAAAFPSVEQVASVLHTCRSAPGLTLKFTAGLHHPLRHFDAGAQTSMHGFLNVLGATVLSQHQGISEEQIQEILREERPEAFVFTDEALRWREFSATTVQIAVSRACGTGSFGSCSFDEPRDDLRALGLL